MDWKEGIKLGGLIASGIFGIIILAGIWMLFTVISGVILSMVIGYPWSLIAGGIFSAFALYGLLSNKNKKVNG